MKIEKNRDKYRFDDFTIGNYRKYLMLLKENKYEFVFFCDEYELPAKKILLRHDVEFSPWIALKMAQIEREENTKSTFFFQVHSDFYNFLEKEVVEIASEIKKMGHEIGLHFDSHYHGIGCGESFTDKIKYDAGIIEHELATPIRAFSFHNTNEVTRSFKDKSYGGLLNAYSSFFAERFRYFSDSTGIWRYEMPEDVLFQPGSSSVQFLIHDAMWSDVVDSPRMRVFRSIEKNAQRVKDNYDETLRKYNASNIDW